MEFLSKTFFDSEKTGSVLGALLMSVDLQKPLVGFNPFVVSRQDLEAKSKAWDCQGFQISGGDITSDSPNTAKVDSKTFYNIVQQFSKPGVEYRARGMIDVLRYGVAVNACILTNYEDYAANHKSQALLIPFTLYEISDSTITVSAPYPGGLAKRHYIVNGDFKNPKPFYFVVKSGTDVSPIKGFIKTVTATSKPSASTSTSTSSLTRLSFGTPSNDLGTRAKMKAEGIKEVDDTLAGYDIYCCDAAFGGYNIVPAGSYISYISYHKYLYQTGKQVLESICGDRCAVDATTPVTPKGSRPIRATEMGEKVVVAQSIYHPEFVPVLLGGTMKPQDLDKLAATESEYEMPLHWWTTVSRILRNKSGEDQENALATLSLQMYPQVVKAYQQFSLELLASRMYFARIATQSSGPQVMKFKGGTVNGTTTITKLHG